MRLIVILYILGVSYGCERVKEVQKALPKLTVVLHDQSVSVKYDSAHVAGFIDKLMAERMTASEDLFFRVPIGANGFDLASMTAYSMTLPDRDLSNLPEFERTKRDREFEEEIKKAQLELADKLRNVFLRSGHEPKTQLLSSLALLQEIWLQHPKHQTELVILSDLILDGEIRSLYTEEFSSVDEANNAAITDVSKLDSIYGLSGGSLTKLAKVTVVFPKCESAGSDMFVNSGFVVGYFREVFKYLGCPSFGTYHQCP